jgi:hypothetical protein
MRCRAGLPIFVFVSRAPEHREELPLVQVRPPDRPVYHRKRDSTGAASIAGLGIALHTLRHSLVTDENEGYAGYLGAGLDRYAPSTMRMIFSTQLATKIIDKILTY